MIKQSKHMPERMRAANLAFCCAKQYQNVIKK